ncbi:MAG: pyridoxamine 5'-phosphate oxidase family protein [Gammaproteobacteria bacterium]|nr:pyridoxamine 5'-phosphate oxidase family protein [Gammaproteobacteria bacterium]
MSAPPPVLTKLELTDDMKHAVNAAFEMRRPMVIAYVDENGAPQLSYRGSTQAFSDTQLAIWVRNPQGRILESIEAQPAVALLYGYFEPNDRGFMIFRGRARIDGSEAVRKRVYEQAHEFERNQDPERRGVAVVIDLDSVDGFFGGARLEMRR